jgi:AcrR family transcriptional regulator
MTTTDRRNALRDRLTALAEQTIATQGLKALKARDLAREAGCALGAIYTVFPTLDHLVLTVNARTFTRLGAFVAAELAQAPEDPRRQMVVMAQAYHAFAAQNRPAWAALFTIDRPEGAAPPDWYLAEMAQLFTLIGGPLARALPDLSPADQAVMARTLFSAVHGIVALGLDQAAAGVARPDIDRMLDLMLSRIAQQPVS